MKPSRFTLCCRLFYLSLVGLWEIIVIKPLLFYSEPLAPFISKNSSLHFCLPILVQLGWVHFPFPLFWWVMMRTGIWLSWSNPWWESCCCTGFSSHFCTFVAYPVSTWCLKKISDPVLSPQSKSSQCIFEEISVTQGRDFWEGWGLFTPYVV